MKIKILLLTQIAVISSYVALACPACNIHNYMGNSIRISNNVFVGKVVTNTKSKSYVKVINVIKGDIQINKKIQMAYVYHQKGDTAIFCIDPSHEQMQFPFYSEYDINDLQEVAFIVKEDSVVTDLNTALMCITGNSYEAASMGIEFFKRNPKYSGNLLKLYDSINNAAINNNVKYFEWKNASITEALLIRNDEFTQTTVLNVLDIFLNPQTENINWDSLDLSESKTGIILHHLLAFSQQHDVLHKLIVDKILSSLPQLTNHQLADFTFAILYSKSIDNKALISKISLTNRDAFALGLFYTGNKLAYYNNKSLAQQYLLSSLEICSNPKLRKSIEDALKRYSFK